MSAILNDATCGYQRVGAWLQGAGCIFRVRLGSNSKPNTYPAWGAGFADRSGAQPDSRKRFGLKHLGFREMASTFAFGFVLLCCFSC